MNPSKTGSFQAFFRNACLPKLEEFERVRKRRQPLLAALFVVLNLLAAVPFCLVTPAAWGSWPLVLVETVLLGAAIVIAGRLGWRGLDRKSKSTLGALQLAMAGVILFTLMVRGGEVGRGSFYILVLCFAAAGGLLEIIDRAFHDLTRRRQEFSRDVVVPLVDYALPGMESRPAVGMKQGDFLESRLFSAGFSRFTGRNYFAASRNGYNLSFSWVTAEHIPKDKHGRPMESAGQLVFFGWFFAVHFARRFDGHTLVLPDRAEKTLGWLGRSLQDMATPAGVNLIHLENMEFEHYFKVLSTGQLQARFILTPVVMPVLTAFRKRLGGSVLFSFWNERMYVAVPAKMEYFGSMANQSFTDPAFFRHLFHAVRGVDELAGTILKHQVVWEDNAPHQP